MSVSSATRRSSGPVLRSLSPSGRFYTGGGGGVSSHTPSSRGGSSPFASSTSSTFSSHQFLHHNHNHNHNQVHHREASPTRVNLYSSGSASSSAAAVHFSIDRNISPNRSINAQPLHRRPSPAAAAAGPKKTCMCSPTNHPGSFRCSLHKNSGSNRQKQQPSGPYQSNRLYARRSAMTNSLVRIGTVEGDLVKRALAALIRPSSHSQRRRADFQPRPSRLSSMSTAAAQSFQ